MKTSAPEVIGGILGLVCSAGLFLALAPAFFWTAAVTIALATWANKYATPRR